MKKTCTKCHTEKEIDGFSKRNDRPCGFKSSCKLCDLESKKNSQNYKVVTKKANENSKEYRQLWKQSEKGKESAKIYNIKTKYAGQKRWNKTDDGKEYTKTKNDKDKDYRIERHLNSKYGLTIQSYKELSKNQNDKCACCHVHISDLKNKINKLVVDHCHITDNIRGLLCHSCNLGIGLLGDDKKSILMAVTYLENYEQSILKKVINQ